MVFSFKLIAALLFFALGVAADAWVPPIITPNKATIWCIGSTVAATWYVHPIQVSDPCQPAEVVGGLVHSPALNVISTIQEHVEASCADNKTYGNFFPRTFESRWLGGLQT